MKFIQYLSLSIVSSFLFMQCSSAQKLQKEAAFQTDKAYYQKWVAGLKDGGSGINVFIPIDSNSKNLKLDSLYFRGHIVPLQTKPNFPDLYIGRITTNANQPKDYSVDTSDIPFDLKDNEAVVSYTENGTTKYLKIENLVEKQMEQYPSAPPRNLNKQ
ncbi:hypothetical protein [Olleya sp. UBA1516]|jgi:hypothetical protein|uniref:hypothetical protein n=1 Tax=Olleya sp. UBA1516 TaxID=1947013 RepID=UPI0025F45F4C|nr:hypothetical protein [Olleya sp. UBA1516]